MITKRQLQFLWITSELTAEAGNNGGVHYTQVAERMGVSRWTAYDILTALAETGYLQVERSLKDKEKDCPVGRARVLFCPTSKARQLLTTTRDTGVALHSAASGTMILTAHEQDSSQESLRESDLWERSRSFLVAKVRESKERGTREVLKDVLAEVHLRDVACPLIWCAYLLVLGLLAFRAVNDTAEGSRLLDNLTSLLLTSHGTIILFLGSLIGALTWRAQRTYVEEYLKVCADYANKTRGLDQHSETVLTQFTTDIVGELWPSAATGQIGSP